MKSKPQKFLVILAMIILLVDLLTMRGLNLFLTDPDPLFTTIISSLHWGISAIFLLLIIAGMTFKINMKSVASSRRMFAISGAFVLFYFPKLIFVAFNVLDELIFQTARFMSYEGEYMLNLSWAGAVLAVIAFFGVLYGMIFEKHWVKTTRQTLSFPGLPKDFDGLKLVHISDYHLGSISPRSSYPEKVTRKINKLKPDMIMFTGDLINNVAEEAKPWINSLKAMKAKKGKFAITGNHDYGDYVNWDDEQEKKENEEKFRSIFQQSGFELLDNKGVEIQKNDSSIGILGIENWGAPPFPQYGKLNVAMEDIKNSRFHILLSHDPSHWRGEVIPETNIALTLSGHTHGFQFGLLLGKLKWSPVQYKYPEWAGHYKNGNQHLYINRGLGYIGFPGRMGMPPEITEITLRKG